MPSDQIDLEKELRGCFPDGRLYHGTISTLANGIAIEGLQPRAITKMAVTARTGRAYFDSDESMVYLASASAPVYAGSIATQLAGPANGKIYPCVVEIDTAKLQFANLHPDEDYVADRLLADEIAKTPLSGERLEKRRSEIQAAVKSDPEAHRSWICESMKTLGSIAHRGPISLDAITGIAVMDNDDAFSFLSHMINFMTKSRAGSGLTAGERGVGPLLTRWLLGDVVSASDLANAMAVDKVDEKTLDHFATRLAIRPRLLKKPHA